MVGRSSISLKLVTHVLFFEGATTMNPPVPFEQIVLKSTGCADPPVVSSVVGKFGALEEIVVTFLRPLAQSSRVQKAYVHLCRFPYSRCRPRTDPAKPCRYPLLCPAHSVACTCKRYHLLFACLYLGALLSPTGMMMSLGTTLLHQAMIVLELGRHDF
jgi:hypothetical protein